MDAIKNKLNSNNFKEYMKVGDLIVDRKYSVDNFCINKTQYGLQLSVDVDNTHRLNLPKRFLNKFSVNDCKIVNEQQDKLVMVYKGIKNLEQGNKLYLIEFE